MGKGGDGPEAPDYKKLMTQQGDINKNAATGQTYANRPDQTTPWAQMEWDAKTKRDPVTGKKQTFWEQTQTLDKDTQRALDAQQRIQRDASEDAKSMFGGASKALQKDVNYDKFMDITDVEDPFELRAKSEDAAYGRATNRLDPQFKESAEQLEIKLRNKGLRSGDQAYEAEMDRFNRGKADAYEQARLGATGEGRLESGQAYTQQQSQQSQSARLRQQDIAEAMQKRGYKMDDIERLLASNRVAGPNFEGFKGATGYKPPDYYGAAKDQYGAEQDAYNLSQAQQQQFMTSLFGAGSAAASFASDRRLKRDIKRIGTWRSYPFYSFTYIWGQPSTGVMSDEVNADAVSVDSNGFDMVDYTRVH